MGKYTRGELLEKTPKNRHIGRFTYKQYFQNTMGLAEDFTVHVLVKISAEDWLSGQLSWRRGAGEPCRDRSHRDNFGESLETLSGVESQSWIYF